MTRHRTQPGASEANEVSSSWGLKNIPRKGLAFQAATQACPSSQSTACCSGVLAMTLMAGESWSCWVPWSLT